MRGLSCLPTDRRRTHPDYFVIEPDRELATPQIKIEQVRDIEHQIIYRPLMGERKICLIDQADRMTIGAANALLKTLEEPPGHSFILVIPAAPRPAHHDPFTLSIPSIYDACPHTSGSGAHSETRNSSGGRAIPRHDHRGTYR